MIEAKIVQEHLEATPMKSSSPIVPRDNSVSASEPVMDFYKALKMIFSFAGSKITRLDWADRAVYGEVIDGTLKIYKEDKYHDWIVGIGDAEAVDWIKIN